MKDAYRESGTSIDDIEPLMKDNAERMEAIMRNQRSRNIIEACRPVCVGDWLAKGMGMGAFLGMIVSVVLTMPTALAYLRPHEQLPTILLAVGMPTIVTTATVTALLLRWGCVLDRKKALVAHSPSELAWHECQLRISARASQFDTRLRALKSLAANADGESVLAAATVTNVAAERAHLDSMQRALARGEALRQLKEIGYDDMNELLVTAGTREYVTSPDAKAPVPSGVRVAICDDDGTDFTVAHYQNRWKA